VSGPPIYFLPDKLVTTTRNAAAGQPSIYRVAARDESASLIHGDARRQMRRVDAERVSGWLGRGDITQSVLFVAHSLMAGADSRRAGCRQGGYIFYAGGSILDRYL